MDIEAGISTAPPERQAPRAEPAGINPELFARNLEAFRQLLPALHERLEQISRTRSVLIADPGGGYDIELGGTRLYGGNHRSRARRRVADFFKSPEDKIRIRLSPPDTRSLDAHANKSVYRVMKRATKDRGIVFAVRRTTTECHHMIVLGIGLGEHIPPLVRRTNCRHLILVEPNIEFLYHSLHTFDWGRFFSGYLRDGRRINFVTDVSPQDIATTIRGQIRFTNVPAVDGSYVFIAYPGSFLEAVAGDLAQKREMFLTGLGFLEDERDMVRNSYQNLVDYHGKFISRHDCALSVPAFVIASGPSIDNDLDFIRANADRAIVISCGTSLRILLNNGIRPDFHMEMENVPAVHDLISKWAESHSLKGITLVATTTIDPRVKSLFDRTIFYIRPGIASCPMFEFGDDTVLTLASPMVANLGLSFAQHVNAKTIYLFGIDCGARDPKRHHGKDAPYNAGEIEFTTTIDRPVAANFGGIVYSETVYLWSRDDLQNAIRVHTPGLIHYNCSDGIRIEGATPKLSRAIALPACDKAAAVAKAVESYPDYLHEKFDAAWTDRNHVRTVLEFRNKLIDAIELGADAPETAGAGRSGKDPLAFLSRLAKCLIPATTAENTAEHHYFRGTIYLAAIAMYFYHGRVVNPRKRAVFLRLIREELIALVNDIADYVIAFYRELDPEKTARDEDAAADLLKPAPRPETAARKEPVRTTRRRRPTGRKRPAATKSRRAAPKPTAKGKRAPKRSPARNKRPSDRRRKPARARPRRR